MTATRYTAVGVFGDEADAGQVRRIGPARRRNRDRQTVQSGEGHIQRITFNDNVLARGCGDDAWRDRRGNSARPSLMGFGKGHAETDLVDARARSRGTDQHRHAVALALGIDHIGE